MQERFGTQHGEMLHTIDGPFHMLDTIDGPFRLVHADLADLNFFNKPTVAPKYCLVCIDLFTLTIYTNEIKHYIKKIIFENRKQALDEASN